MGGMPTEDAGSSGSADPSDTLRDELELGPQPTRLDRYVLLEQIGRGSFASVWAAYDPQLDRRVALKILRSAHAMEQSSGAQLAEAQALARLSHPNVVAVHDVQSSAQGVFIVMEFLAGASLREWMDEQQPWREVVRVFIEAGRGLAAAHERGLVHRDFKPSNVMFGADGRVRVLDFGLARSTVARESTESQSKPRVTGTPAYMAAEQHLGESADARSDQFAYCVALYEALYGQRPFAGRDRIALGKAKLQGDIRPPPRASSVPAWLHAVVLRGLAVDRAARWPDMNALLDALAHDPSLVRRRWAVAIGLMVVLGGAAFGLARLQAGDDGVPQICGGSERELVGVWDDAKRAELRDSFAATQLRYADDAYRRVAGVLDERTEEWVQVHREVCEATMVRQEQSLELMAEQMMCLQRRLRQLSGLVTTLARADSSSVARSVEAVHGLQAPASCRERGVELHAELLDLERRNDVLELEGEIAEAGVLTQLGRYDEAIEVARAATDHAQALADADGAGRAWLAQTRALWYLGRYDDSIAASEQAMRWAAKAGDDETFAMAQLRLLRTYTAMGKYDVAEAVAKIAAVTIEDGRLGRELEAWYDLYVAMLYYRQLRWDEAVARLEHGIELRTQLFGPEHPELAAFHNTWGNTLFGQRQFEGALQHYREALRLWESNYGPEYPDIALVNNNIGAILLDRGRYDEARPYFERVVASYEASLRADTPQMAMTLSNLALVAARKGHRRQSLALYQRARRIISAKQGDDNVSAAQIDAGTARLLFKLDEIERAESMITRVLEIQRRDAPENLPVIIASTELLAACQYARGDFGAWRSTLERLLDELQTRELEGPYTAIALYLRAQLARQAGERETAIELAELHLAALAAVLEPGDEELAHRSWLLVELLLASGEHEAAATRAREALAVTHMDRADRDRWELEYLLGRAEAGRGDRAAARAALQRALEYCSGPDGNPSQAELVREQLAALGD